VAVSLQGAYGPGSGPILLDDVTCVGTEYSLDDCGHSTWGNNNCKHTEDAAVICQSGTICIL
jgi:hypothetical protein